MPNGWDKVAATLMLTGIVQFMIGLAIFPFGWSKP